MAVLALGFAGQAIGGAIGGSILGVSAASIGGFIGSTVGNLLDNMLFAGSSKVEGPRVEDRRVMASTYGMTLPRVWGPENRLAGLVIWSTGLLETVKKTKQGGKGGPSVTTTEYSYRVSFALALADGVRRPCQRVSKVWANSKLIYDADGTGSPPVTETLFSALRFYPGDFDQLPDPTIESYLGVGNAPAYRGTCYIVIDDLQLADFGNRLPNIEVLLEADSEISLPVVLTDICEACGANLNDVSTSGLYGENVRGYIIGGASRGADAIQPLALVYGFDAAEQGGNLRFVKRGQAVKGVIPLADMGAYEGFDAVVPEPIRFDLMAPFALPREAVVTYADPERDYQKNSQPSRRQFGDADSNLSYDVPVVIDGDQARQVADRMLFEAWTARRTAAFTTNLRWRSAKPGETYFVESPAGLTRVRITRALRGANGLIQFETREDDPSLYNSNALGVAAAVPEQVIVGIPAVEPILLDIPLLLDADENTAEGFYWGLAPTGDGWRGADLLRALDPAGPYSEVAPQGVELNVGEIAGDLIAIPEGFDSATDWDDTSVLTVTLRRSALTLETLTDDEVLAGGNAIYVGPAADTPNGEIVQFANADLIAPGVYELSRFRRGQRGTEFAGAEAHGDGELFVLLEVGALQRSNFGFADLNAERSFKAVPLLGQAEDAVAVQFTNTGSGLRPYAPVDLSAIADGSPTGDIALAWTRRSRIGNNLTPPPLAEESELYKLEILDNASPPAVVRTVEPTSPGWTYTEADQTADFGAPVTSLRWRVAQVSATYGPGAFAESDGPV